VALGSLRHCGLRFHGFAGLKLATDGSKAHKGMLCILSGGSYQLYAVDATSHKGGGSGTRECPVAVVPLHILVESSA
jgi:hypothetical protein